MTLKPEPAGIYLVTVSGYQLKTKESSNFFGCHELEVCISAEQTQKGSEGNRMKKGLLIF